MADDHGFSGLIRRFGPRVALGVVIGVVAVLIGGRATHAQMPVGISPISAVER